MLYDQLWNPVHNKQVRLMLLRASEVLALGLLLRLQTPCVCISLNSPASAL